VGDVVQVGELVGIVLNIGLRSSVVKSYDGAEVIVPNGNLISDQMINWTRSDSKRRMDHRVGVAYGTDPEKVLAILESVALEHEKVDKFPKPLPLFIGFGDSSLDFRLLSWTDVDYRFTVESQINIAINRKLKEAGIEIPFPQRDLHIRSDATKSARKVEKSEKEKPDNSKSPSGKSGSGKGPAGDIKTGPGIGDSD
jgi:small-conductance mechanosensitive channel